MNVVSTLLALTVLISQPTAALAPEVDAERVHAAIEFLNKEWHRESTRHRGLAEGLTGGTFGLYGGRVWERSTSSLRYAGLGALFVGTAAMGYGIWLMFTSENGFYKVPAKDWRALNQIFDMSPNKQFQTAMMNPEFAAFLIDLAAFVKGRVGANEVEPAGDL